MTATLESKVALVTGGSRGIGAAIAGPTCTGNAGRQRRSRGGQAEVKQTRGEFGWLDILVNNAGVSVPGPLEDLRLPDVDRTLSVNVRAPLAAAQAAAEHMTRGGRISCIGSNVVERTLLARDDLVRIEQGRSESR